jgi:sporulation-control protein spo0M
MMKKEYDFTDAQQGKFYRPIEELEIPIYIDKDIQKVIVSVADKSNKSISELVNSLLKNDIEIAQSLH